MELYFFEGAAVISSMPLPKASGLEAHSSKSTRLHLLTNIDATPGSLRAMVSKRLSWFLVVCAGVAYPATVLRRTPRKRILSTRPSVRLRQRSWGIMLTCWRTTTFEGREAGSRGGRAAGGYLVHH